MVSDHAPGLDNWLIFEEDEQSYWVEGINGAVPDWVQGSYYVNGPARFQRNSLRYKHWLDGDGMVRALHFSREGVRFVSRYVQSRKLIEEEHSGRPVFRTFGTAFENDKLRKGVMLEPPANVSVYTLGRRLLAFAEQSIPFELDPDSLETKGVFDFTGRLNEVSPFAAHAKLDPRTGSMVNFGISFSSRNPLLYLYEFDKSGGLHGRRRFPVDAPHTNHDFAVSERFAAFFLSPLEMDFERFWRGGASIMESLVWRPEKGSYIYVVPRVGCSDEPFQIRRDSGHCLHLINSYEENGTLILDLVEFKEPIYPEYQPVPNFYQSIGLGGPVRYTINLKEKRLEDRQEMPYDRSPDFPSVEATRLGQSYEDFWMLGISAAGSPGRKFFDQLVRGNWSQGKIVQKYQAPSGCYLGGEPVYVSHPERQDTGLIVIQEYSSKEDRVDFLLFDAYAVSSGPIARLPLKYKTHPGFHASFEYRPL